MRHAHLQSNNTKSTANNGTLTVEKQCYHTLIAQVLTLRTVVHQTLLSITAQQEMIHRA